jgi:UDP-galactose transporter B1
MIRYSSSSNIERRSIPSIDVELQKSETEEIYSTSYSPSSSIGSMMSTMDDEEQCSLLAKSPLSTPSKESRPYLPKHKSMTFIFCVSGIYAAYLLYGQYQEDVFTYQSNHISSTIDTSVAFTYIWFVQVVEALTNTVMGIVGRYMTQSKQQRSVRPNQKYFFYSGFSQVSSKALTSLALNTGLSFPLATMAKSGKMAPVMLGQLILGGTSYSIRDYLQVSAIIFGTAMLGLSKAKGGAKSHSTSLGVVFIMASLAMDGITGGLQKRLKRDAQKNQHDLKGYDFMFYTNLYMFLVALGVANLNGDLVNGISYCMQDPHICILIAKFCVCSAVGQSFIFLTIAQFDPLVCSTVTTTRKIASVFLSIFTKGHHMNNQAWCGVFVACMGILSEVQDKVGKGSKKSSRDSLTRQVS